jgi:hypothetical protein
MHEAGLSASTVYRVQACINDLAATPLKTGKFYDHRRRVR